MKIWSTILYSEPTSVAVTLGTAKFRRSLDILSYPRGFSLVSGVSRIRSVPSMAVRIVSGQVTMLQP